MKFTLPGRSLFSAPKAPEPPPAPPPLPEAATDPNVKAKADAARIAAKRRKGLMSTNLTAGQALGIADDTAPTKPKKLTGS